MNNKSIADLHRSCMCAEVTDNQVGEQVTLMGWCHKQRDLGGLIFITLRDRSGEIQICVNESSPEAARTAAAKTRSEYVLAVIGKVSRRSAPNPQMKTGNIEILADEIRILSEAETPPFYIEEGMQAKDSLRLKYRYLDLRRPDMQRTLILRHNITNIIHRYFNEHGFLEIETPMLGRSTPEGARDYLVPSRVFPGHFFALPQSPQLYKQLLMVAGYDRYVQIARCFRDEDLRADRQPEFTQVDLEMSFVNPIDVQTVVEGLLAEIFAEIKGIKIDLPLQRMPYAEAMERFGSDKPDLRFAMEINNVSDWAAKLDFAVFKNALALPKGRVACIQVPGAASMTRKQIDSLGEFVKTYRASGLAWLAFGAETRGSFLKFVTDVDIAEIKQKLSVKDGDLLLFVADKYQVVQDSLGQLRCEVAKRLNMIDENQYKLLWVTEFPLLEYSEEEHRYTAMHHPFTSPMEEDLPLLTSDPGAVRAKAYDVVLNGTELGGGSIRIHDQDLQKQMFGLLGFTEEQAFANFGFLLEAFRYGVAPHGGCALGLDRLVMKLSRITDIRDVIAFPKVQTSADLMTMAPGTVSDKQLAELKLNLQPDIAEGNE